MKAIFISDAHLRKSGDERYKKLMNFFDTVKEGNILHLVHTEETSTKKAFIDDIYIAGDLFDFWFCQKDKINPEFKPVINKLIELQKAGVRIHLSEGNHDFFMGEYFRDILGMKVFEEWADVQLDNSRTLVAHGDTVDSSNTLYFLFRKILRSSIFYNIQRFIPASIRWTLARLTSTASKELTMEDGDALVEKMLSFAMVKFQDSYNAVILGHCHVPSMHHYTIKDTQRTFITLGDWINYYSFLYYENNNFYLRYYRQ